MSVKIRFTRLGKPKNPFYRIVVTDSRKPRDSRYLDKVGHFNPLIKKEERSQLNFHLDREKIVSWLQKGAQPTQVVLDLLKEEQLWEEFSKSRPKKKKPNKRKSHSHPISEMLKRREEKKKVEEAKKKALANKPKLEKKVETGEKIEAKVAPVSEDISASEADQPAEVVTKVEEAVETPEGDEPASTEEEKS